MPWPSSWTQHVHSLQSNPTWICDGFASREFCTSSDTIWGREVRICVERSLACVDGTSRSISGWDSDISVHLESLSLFMSYVSQSICQRSQQIIVDRGSFGSSARSGARSKEILMLQCNLSPLSIYVPSYPTTPRKIDLSSQWLYNSICHWRVYRRILRKSSWKIRLDQIKLLRVPQGTDSSSLKPRLIPRSTL